VQDRGAPNARDIENSSRRDLQKSSRSKSQKIFRPRNFSDVTITNTNTAHGTW